ncbi:MAG: alpha/beta fold hydrolase [Byssovorax sp.]
MRFLSRLHSSSHGTHAGRAVFAALLAVAVTGAACGSTGQETNTEASGSTGSVITGAGGGPQATSTTAVTATSGDGGGGGMASGAPYPFVFAHGFFGFEKFAGADFLTYYYNVKARLAQDGEIIDTPSVDPFNDSTYRGAQLIDRIETFLAATGAKKVNIIGHSQGGLDARVVAHDRPDLVASVVTIATPHQGTPVADVAMKLLADPNAAKIIDDLGKLLGAPLYDQIGNQTSVVKPLKLFSTAGIAEFNAKYPDAPGVFYASIAGRSSYHGFDNDCAGDLQLQFMTQWNKTLDPVDPLLGATSLLLGSAANDGLVRDKDAKWGEYWGCVPADHLDEIGQLFGDGPGIGNDWDHLNFYSLLVKYIRERGF